MGKKVTLNKEKGVQIIADLLFEGKKTGYIVDFLGQKYTTSRKTVYAWKKVAEKIVNERRETEETEKRKLIKETQAEIVERLGLGLESVLKEYQKIAFSDIRELYDDSGNLLSIKKLSDNAAAAIAGVEVDVIAVQGQAIGETKKVKRWDKKAALDSICRVLGYNAPEKKAETDPEGNPVKPVKQVIIINGKEIEF